jgi:hypothetical protein
MRDPRWWVKATLEFKQDVVGVLNGIRPRKALFTLQLPAIDRRFPGTVAIVNKQGKVQEVRPATEWDAYVALKQKQEAGTRSPETYLLRARLGKRPAAITKQLQREESERLENHARVRQIEEWRTGKAQPPSDIRLCRNRTHRKKEWRHYFLRSASRLNHQYCSEKCRGRYRARKSMNASKRADRNAKLARVRRAQKRYRGAADWKHLTSRHAKVSVNFITYAIRRGEISNLVPTVLRQ